jgi:hypothetical protein
MFDPTPSFDNVGMCFMLFGKPSLVSWSLADAEILTTPVMRTTQQ